MKSKLTNKQKKYMTNLMTASENALNKYSMNAYCLGVIHGHEGKFSDKEVKKLKKQYD